MQIKLFDQNDYQEISKWWKEQNWPIIPVSSLSDCGFVVFDGDTKILAGWLYKTNSDIAWMEFIVGNPQVKGDKRNTAFDILFDTVIVFAKHHNFKHIFTSVQHEGLMKRLEKNGFNKTDSNMTNFIRSL